MAKYLDSAGLAHLWNKVKTYVGNYVTLTVNNGKYTLTVYNTTVNIPKWVIDAGDSKPTYTLDEISDGTSYVRMSSSEKTKLSGIETGAEVNVVETVNTTAGTSGLNLSLSSGELGVSISAGSIVSGNSNFVTGGTVYNTTNLLAPKESPALSGTPTAPTAAAGTNNSQIATTEFVNSAINTASAGLASFQGTLNDPSELTGLTDYKNGWYWVIQTAGTYVGEVCEVGDMVFCISDYSSAYSTDDFSVVQTNMDMTPITTTEIDTITNA